MSGNNKQSHTIIYLLLGFSIFVTLLAFSWYITSSQLEDYEQLNEVTLLAGEKMEAINSLIEIARKRTRLSHEMLIAEDVFERDEIGMEIIALAGDFITNRSNLMALKLSAHEKEILESQLPLYPKAIEGLEKVAELALEDTDEATEIARNIIVREIVPAQGKIIDGFNLLMRVIDNKVAADSRAASENNIKNRKIRLLLMLLILLISIVTIVFVIRNVLAIEHRLHDLSTTDELTGILNRRSFNARFQQEWKRAIRVNQSMSMLLIDIDHFKQYNDHYGHQNGDDCLIQIANTIQHVANRSEDIVARYGGEEFAVVLPNTDESGARIVAGNLLEQVRRKNIRHEGSHLAEYVTISIGSVSIDPSVDNSVDDLITAADAGLYEAKDAGRNRATFISLEPYRSVQQSLAL